MSRIDEIISNALAGIEETEVAILARELLKTREDLALAQQAKGEAEGRAALADRRAVLRNQKLAVVSAPPAGSVFDELIRKYEGVTFSRASPVNLKIFRSSDLAKTFIKERIAPDSSGVVNSCQETDKPGEVNTEFVAAAVRTLLDATSEIPVTLTDPGFVAARKKMLEFDLDTGEVPRLMIEDICTGMIAGRWKCEGLVFDAADDKGTARVRIVAIHQHMVHACRGEA